jgi:hypothetical protein
MSARSIAKPGASAEAPRRSLTIGAGSRPAIKAREQISLAANAEAYSAGWPSNSGPGGVGLWACASGGGADTASTAVRTRAPHSRKRKVGRF